MITVASFTDTVSPTMNESLSPLRAVASIPSVKSDDITFPLTTCINRISARADILSSVS